MYTWSIKGFINMLMTRRFLWKIQGLDDFILLDLRYATNASHRLSIKKITT